MDSLEPGVESPASVSFPSGLRPSHGCAGCLVAGCVAGLGTTVLFVLLYRTAGRLGDQALNDPFILLALLILTQLSLLVGVAVGLDAGKVGPREGLALRRVPFRWLPLAIAGMLAFSLGSDWLVMQLRTVERADQTALGQLANLLGAYHGPAFVLVLLFVGVAPAVCEEGLFRGLLFTAWRTRYSAAASIGVTALAFALIHADRVQSPSALLLGVYLGLLRERSGSLYLPVAAHLANNLLAGLLLSQTNLDQALRSGGGSGAIALAGVLIGLLCLRPIRSGRP